MFDLREYYLKQNQEIEDSYRNSILRLKEIIKETQQMDNPTEYSRFFNQAANFMLRSCEYEDKLDDGYFMESNYDDLLRENHEFYTELLPENYASSYANPTYCVKVFGDGLGQILSFVYNTIRNQVEFAFMHKLFKMHEYNKYFIDIYDYCAKNEIEKEKLTELATVIQRKDKATEMVNQFKEEYNKDFRYFTDIVEKSDLQDLRYLFKAGKYITDYEIRVSKFLQTYPEVKLETLAKEIVKAYLKGFSEMDKDPSSKSTIGLYYNIGMERLFRVVIREFRKVNLETTIQGVYGADINKQYDLDHKFDNSLYLNEEFVEKRLNSLEKALEATKDIMAEYSGILFFERFGEKPFSPERKTDILKLSEEQQKLYMSYINQYRIKFNEYVPESETSFCIVALPSPEIGKQFEEIFEATMEINMLDSDWYEKVQQKIIDVLDEADKVHIKGKGNNKTDLIVKMPEIKNSAKETNYMNCGASLNIPVGEVFTSPQLVGTNGVLHVEETYQGFPAIRYDNLTMTFKDGYVEDYSCTNFDTEEENRKYIEENLLFPHKTLPMGEFAIGTNTLAYVVANKYKIMNILPVLIIEKTGPHIAIGDTCYSRKEDLVYKNRLNNKVVIAKDNDKSILRKKDINEAYTNKHNDITLPFDSLGFITAIKKDGTKIDLIKDGRFVLKGTEELNKPLDENK